MRAKSSRTSREIAIYEIMAEEGTYWGEIPGRQGVWANHQTLEGGRRELREALSDWVALRLRLEDVLKGIWRDANYSAIPPSPP